MSNGLATPDGTLPPQSMTRQALMEAGRFKLLPLPLRVILYCMMGTGTLAFLYYNFSWSFIFDLLEPTQYYYLLYLLFCPAAFLLMAARKKDKTRIPWYDYALAALTLIIFAYFFIKSYEISRIVWVPAKGWLNIGLAVVIALVSLEGGRRLGGLALSIVCLIFGLYPLFADQMPGYLYGISFSWQEIVSNFAYGKSGLLGLPAQTTGDLLIGYLIFSGVLTGCGAGEFFIKVALALMGRFRGGPAKVCVFASCLFGTLTGSAIAEVASVGNITIATMKRIGYPAHYAGGIEAVAANGGAIMPPVMGAIIFIMAIITGINYSTIVVAAILPAIFYYFSLLLQVDFYAVKHNIKGLSKEEIPHLGQALKEGWPFLFGIIFLCVGLIYFQWGVKSALYASVLLLVATASNRANRLNKDMLLDIIKNTGYQCIQIMSVLMPVGFILMGFEMTGTLTRLTAAIVSVATSNVWLVLMIAVIVSFVFGMVGVSFISYLILAAIAIPAVVAATQMSVIGLHFFMIWWLLVGAINPPVAVVSFVAAAVADAPPMKTAWTATRLAAVTYFIPFFFVFQPALLFEGSLVDTAIYFVLGLIGIYVVCTGLEGYSPGLGNVKWWARIFFLIGGFLVAMPEWISTIAGFAITGITAALVYLTARHHERNKPQVA